MRSRNLPRSARGLFVLIGLRAAVAGVHALCRPRAGAATGLTPIVRRKPRGEAEGLSVAMAAAGGGGRSGGRTTGPTLG